jgi:hypothetical protein
LSSAANAVETPGRDLIAAAAAARAAGAVIAAGYLFGVVPGPIVAMAGGLALITLGRALLADRGADLLIAAAFSVAAGALGIGAFRWGSLQLGDVRGAQAVLGPTVLVGPTGASLAGWLAVAGSVVAMAVWVGTARRSALRLGGPVGTRLGAVVETLLASLAVVTVFWGPAISGDKDRLAAELGAWAAAVVAVALVIGALAFFFTRLSLRWRAFFVAIALVAVMGAAGLVASLP